MRRVTSQLLPFLFAGMAVVALFVGIFLLSYLIIFGACVGFILFVISWIRQKFFSPKTIVKPSKKSGRTIDSSDWRRL